MILSVVAALMASGDVLPEISRASLGRQARLEAQRGPGVHAVDRPREASVSTGANGAAATPGRTPRRASARLEPRLENAFSIVGM